MLKENKILSFCNNVLHTSVYVFFKTFLQILSILTEVSADFSADCVDASNKCFYHFRANCYI